MGTWGIGTLHLSVKLYFSKRSCQGPWRHEDEVSFTPNMGLQSSVLEANQQWSCTRTNFDIALLNFFFWQTTGFDKSQSFSRTISVIFCLEVKYIVSAYVYANVKNFFLLVWRPKMNLQSYVVEFNSSVCVHCRMSNAMYNLVFLCL